MEFKTIRSTEIRDNAVGLIKNDWTLLAAGTEQSFNMMTASWGALGELWGKDVFFAFVRHSRYTFEFFEKNDTFSCSFFPSEYRGALNICGSKSGRDIDKVKETGLTPVFEGGSVWFSEARLVLVCRKLYADDIKPEKFIDGTALKKSYPGGDFHRMYVGEIVSCMKKD